MLPAVSVVVPFKDSCQPFQALFGQLQQAMAKAPGRLEVLVVDDHSQPDATDALRKLIADSAGFRVLQNRGKAGVGAARNIGIEHSLGEYVYFADSDDAIDAERFESVSQALLDSGTRFDIVFANHVRTSTNTAVAWPATAPLPAAIVELDKPQLLALTEQFCKRPRVPSIVPHCWNKFFRNDLLRARQLRFSERYNQLEDVEFVARCCQAASTWGLSEVSLYAHALNTDGRLSRTFFFPDDLVPFTESTLLPLASLMEQLGASANSAEAHYRKCVEAYVATYAARALNALTEDFRPSRLAVLTRALGKKDVARVLRRYRAGTGEDPLLGPLISRGVPAPLIYLYWRFGRKRLGLRRFNGDAAPLQA